MRFRNTQDITLDVQEAGVTVGHGGEFDWPDYDPEVHGVVTGCEPLDAPKDPRNDPPASTTPATTTQASGGQAPPASSKPEPTTPATAADPDKEPKS